MSSLLFELERRLLLTEAELLELTRTGPERAEARIASLDPGPAESVTAVTPPATEGAT